MRPTRRVWPRIAVLDRRVPCSCRLHATLCRVVRDRGAGDLERAVDGTPARGVAAVRGVRRLVARAHAHVPFSGATAISAGSASYHACAVGGGCAQMLGRQHGRSDRRWFDVAIPDPDSGDRPHEWRDRGRGGAIRHTCAVVIRGGVKCWGTNSTGQLGDGSLTQRLTPVAVTGLGSGVSHGRCRRGSQLCAHDGRRRQVLGSERAGQLGDNTTTQRTTPVNVIGLSSGVLAITAGKSHTCAMTSAGAVKCWGSNATGQLGDGSGTNRRFTGSTSADRQRRNGRGRGNGHTCALVSGGAKCWGSNVSGQVGDGSQTQRPTPVDVTGLTSGVTRNRAGSHIRVPAHRDRG